ncbi:MAG: peptidase S24 [Muribaculaceae bacterium]|nr:peptidase S24 [Muribaculaceae bacterium]MDE6321391.1 peptidase S24 [Muribaculaceae bacterium]
MKTSRFSGEGDTSITPPDISTMPTSGFPSPAKDYMADGIDLNRVLISNRPTTFFARADGSSMQCVGISDGDLVIVDKSLSPTLGDVVVAWIDGQFTLRQLTAHPDFDMIWGVVTHSIHTLK